MTQDVNSQLIRKLFNGAQLTIDDVVDLMHAARSPNPEEAKIADQLIPEASIYLEHWYLDKIIGADITDEECKAEIEEQKRFFNRLSNLLPAVLAYLKFDDKSDAIVALRYIDDCFNDFRASSRNRRRDKIERDALRSFAAAIDALTKAIPALEKVERSAKHEFEEVYKAFYQHIIKYDIAPESSYEILLRDMRLCLDHLELAKFRSRTEDDYLIISDNQARRSVVEYAYDISRNWGGPPLLTTPGSEFSSLCSLLYELASGTADESLAGAINRFARSAKRKKKDAEEAEYQEEQREEETDNCSEAKHDIRYAVKKYNRYKAALNSKELSEGAKILVKAMILDQAERVNTAMNKYGPNLVWASQIPQSESDERRKELEELERKVKQLRIELGKVRRASREST